jgi:uncharacterized protein (DUF58 family)
MRNNTSKTAFYIFAVATNPLTYLILATALLLLCLGLVILVNAMIYLWIREEMRGAAPAKEQVPVSVPVKTVGPPEKIPFEIPAAIVTASEGTEWKATKAKPRKRATVDCKLSKPKSKIKKAAKPQATKKNAAKQPVKI